MNELGSMISNTAFNILFLVSFYIQAVHLVKTFVQSHFQNLCQSKNIVISHDVVCTCAANSKTINHFAKKEPFFTVL